MRLPFRTQRARAELDATVDPEQVREGVRAGPLLPYERLMPGDDPTQAARILTEGWTLGAHSAIPLTPPPAWDEVAASSRSWHYHLHCWDALGPLLAAHSESADGGALAAACAVAHDWAQSYPSLQTTSPFAWYDMAVGIRAYRLAYLLDAIARRDTSGDDEIALLTRCALLHRAALDDEGSFAGHSNHGLYQAAGHLALARRFPGLPGMEQARETALRRLAALVGNQFTREGVHREHSPGYHLLVLDALLRMHEAGLFDGPELERVIARAEDALAWFVQPDGRLAMIGDTGYGFAPTGHYRSPALRFMVSAGREGAAASEPLRAFVESGYVVLRGPWPRGTEDFAGGSYLAMQCGFHSRAHKHADDLSFVWHDHRRDLLIDAGRYGFLGRTEPNSSLWLDGFNYSDPARVYVESTRAHNTVEVDGLNLPRRDVEQYGSGLWAWGRADAVLFAEGRTRHRGGVNHARVVALSPGAWLVVVDLLEDPAGRPHRYRQWFQFAPEMEVTAAVPAPDPSARNRLAIRDDGALLLEVIPLTGAQLAALHRGQRDPELAGWTSREPGRLIPCWSAAFEVEPAQMAAMATVFTLAPAGGAPRASPDAAPTPNPAASRIAADHRMAELTWRDAAGTHRLALTRRPDDSQGGLELEHATTA